MSNQLLFKSDETIEAEYAKFKQGEFHSGMRSMSHRYKNNAFEALIEWIFDDYVDGGFTSCVEYFIYTTQPNTSGICYFKYQTSNWFPDSVYVKMTVIIAELLSKHYNQPFMYLNTNDFNDSFSLD